MKTGDDRTRPMPTEPQRDGWRRGAIRLRSVPDRAFMGLVDGDGNAWEAYHPLPRRCRPGSKEWRHLERCSRAERHESSNYQHALVEVEGEWWWAERFVIDGRSNLDVVHGLGGRKATDHWAQTRRSCAP